MRKHNVNENVVIVVGQLIDIVASYEQNDLELFLKLWIGYIQI